MTERINNLISEKQYTLLRQELQELNEVDIAALLDELDHEESFKIFRLLPKDMAADVFAYLDIETGQMIISSLSDSEAKNIIDNLFADDAVSIIEEMPSNVVKRLLMNANPETRRDINQLLQYPDDSAGSIMTVEFVDLKANLTVEQALSRIRRDGVDKETINTCYVLDEKRKLIGTVSLRKLLLSSTEKSVENIMNDNYIAVNTLEDQEEVAQKFQKYDLDAMPVVDSENRLVGIITVDDVVDIMQQEATEDIEMMAAIIPGEKPYLKTSVWETWKSRIPWLLILMFSSAFTGKIITSFEDALQNALVLTAYIPMLMGTGGNSGGQSSVTIIRALSLGEVYMKDIFKVIWKEARVALLCGITLAVGNFAKMMIFDGGDMGTLNIMAVSLVVSLALVVSVLCAKIVGCVLPILVKRIGLDPAVMASPLITTIIDVLSLLLYFWFAMSILPI